MPELQRRPVALLIAGRVLIVTVLMGSAALTRPGTLPIGPFFFLIGLVYALSLVYAATARAVERHRWLIDLQLATDAGLVSGFIYCSGGINSYFSTLYVLPIISASALRSRRAGLLIATLSTGLYGSLVAFQYVAAAGFVRDPWGALSIALPSARLASYTVAINVFGFLAVALLSGSLAERLRSADARLERASTQIADLQAFNQHVIDSLTSGLVTTDRRGRILTFNPAAEAITGHAASAVIGHRVGEVLQLPAEVVRALDADSDRSSFRRAEYHYQGAEGQMIEIGFSVSHLRTPGDVRGLLFAFQDVTEIKRLERDARVQQRLAAVGEMAAGIAHEIRNPLASISGSIQILRQEVPLSEEQAQLMDIVLRESERLNDTIRSFLAYARPQRFTTSRLDVRGILTETAVLLRNSAELRDGHVVDVEVPATEVWYEADEGQIRQIVWNLATNGLRAMPQGGRLRLVAVIERRTADGPETDVELRVEDEGVGISPEDLDRIFQPFRGTFSKGTGLGLSIVHRIVTDYNGEIHVSSKPGAGTIVRVRLPARVAAVA